MPGTTKSRFGLSPTLLFPLGAIGVLAAAFLVYYFPFTAHQEASLDTQAFHALAAVGDQFEKIASNFASVMKQASKKQLAGDPRPAIEFLADQVPDVEPVECGEPPKSPRPGFVTARPVLARDKYYLELRYQKDRKSTGEEQAAAQPAPDLCGQFAIEGVFARLLAGIPKDLFDEVVLTSADGNALVQSGTTGMRLANLGSLLSGAAPKTASRDPGASRTDSQPGPPESFASLALTSSLRPRVEFAGDEYRLYLVPVRLTLLDAEGRDGTSAVRLALGGFIRSGRFRDETRSVPGNVLCGIVLAVLLVIAAAWPLLKFRKMRATERISRRAGLYYALLLMTAVALAVLLALHLRYSVDCQQTDEQLARLSSAIDDHLATELDLALRTMDALMLTRKYRETRLIKLASEETEVPTRTPDLLTEPGLSTLLARYPYFDQVLWTDLDAFQQMKWSVQRQTKPHRRMTEYPTFQETARGNLWQLADTRLYRGRFRVDPQSSPNTGEELAFISVVPAVQPANREPGVALGQMKMITPLLSLIEPVLPPGFGFAILDASAGDGQVLFHFIPTRNLRENFYNECREPRSLIAAIAARRPVYLNADYFGKEHRLLVKPIRAIDDCPWSLVTFRDLSAPKAQHLQTILLCAVLSFAYYGLLALVALVLIKQSEYPVAWVWPREGRRARYRHAIAALLPVAAGFYFLIFEAAPGELLAAVLILPAGSVYLLALKLQGRDDAVLLRSLIAWFALLLASAVSYRWSGQAHGWRYLALTSLVCASFVFLSLCPATRWFRPRRQAAAPGLRSEYALLGVVLLTIASVLPCVAFFKVAYDFEENLFTREAELRTLAAIEMRETRVKEWYRRVKLSSAPEPEADRAARWLFLWKRLNAQSLDRYDEVFLSSRPWQRIAARGPSSPGGVAPDALPAFLVRLAGVLPFSQTLLAPVLARPPENLEDSEWVWSREGDNRLRLRSSRDFLSGNLLHDTPETTGLPKLVSGDPEYQLHDVLWELRLLPGNLPEALPALLLVGAAMFFLIRSTIGRLFLFDFRKGGNWREWNPDEPEAVERNLILLGLPLAGKSQWLKARAGVQVLNVAEFLRNPRIDLRALREPVVALDHFEHGMFDAHANSRKLELLEALLFQAKKRVWIVTTIDPVFYFHDTAVLESLAPGQENERWANVLMQFEIRRLTPAPHRDTLDYYRLLWGTCTRSEKSALYQIATEGWANYKTAAGLEHLRKRGLIYGCPQCRIADERFRTHIRGRVGAEERLALQRHERSSAWDGVGASIWIVLAATVAAVIFLNLSQWLGVLTTVIGVLGAANRLMSELRGRRAGAAPEVEA